MNIVSSNNRNRAADVQESVDAALRQFAAGIAELRKAYGRVWGGSDEEICAFFDELGVEKAAAMLAANSALASVLNPAIADRNAALISQGSLPITNQRLPDVMARPLRFPDENHEGFYIAEEGEE